MVSIDGGSFDPDSTFSLSQSRSVGTFLDGPTYLGTADYGITLTATDPGGLSDSCIGLVRVKDASSPFPDDLILDDVTGECSAEITTVPTATDNCAGSVLGTTTRALRYEAQGEFTVDWSYVDPNENTAGQSQTVIVKDVTPPVITGVVSTLGSLWPPNHKMVTVDVVVDVKDNCGGPVSCSIKTVSSNEPIDGLGDGDTAPDWEILGDLSVNLRAERSGKGSGREYTITVECIDENSTTSGTSVAHAAVFVPLMESTSGEQ